MRRLLPILALTAFCAILAAPASAATRTVVVDDFAYKPKRVSIRKNSTVVWRFRDSAPHNVATKRGRQPQRFKSRTARRFTYRKKFTKRGRYNLYCSIHPFMTMTLRVR